MGDAEAKVCHHVSDITASIAEIISSAAKPPLIWLWLHRSLTGCAHSQGGLAEREVDTGGRTCKALLWVGSVRTRGCQAFGDSAFLPMYVFKTWPLIRDY